MRANEIYSIRMSIDSMSNTQTTVNDIAICIFKDLTRNDQDMTEKERKNIVHNC